VSALSRLSLSVMRDVAGTLEAARVDGDAMVAAAERIMQ